MQLNAKNVEEYVTLVTEERRDYFSQLRQTILAHIPKGFSEQINYGMIGYVVPHSTYPDGYHCKPTDPLPFANIASQKNFIGLYHMGIYSDPELLDWFVSEYPKHCSLKLDMGKSCVRFKKPEQIPFELIGELMTKVSVNDWIKTYETVLKK